MPVSLKAAWIRERPSVRQFCCSWPFDYNKIYPKQEPGRHGFRNLISRTVRNPVIGCVGPFFSKQRFSPFLWPLIRQSGVRSKRLGLLDATP